MATATEPAGRAPADDGPGPGLGRRVLAILGAGGRRAGPVVNGLFVLGAALVVWSGVIHLRLWASGYRDIPGATGPLFLMQGIVAIVLAALVIAFRRVWVGLAAAGFVLSTVAGFLISVNYGLFGFQDSFTVSDGELAFSVELAAAAVLLAACGGAVWRDRAQAKNAKRSSTGAGAPVESAPVTKVSVENP